MNRFFIVDIGGEKSALIASKGCANASCVSGERKKSGRLSPTKKWRTTLLEQVLEGEEIREACGGERDSFLSTEEKKKERDVSHRKDPGVPGHDWLPSRKKKTLNEPVSERVHLTRIKRKKGFFRLFDGFISLREKEKIFRSTQKVWEGRGTNVPAVCHGKGFAEMICERRRWCLHMKGGRGAFLSDLQKSALL